MNDEVRPGGGEMVRHLLLALERFAAHGLASGAVKGVSEEVQSEIPGLTQEMQLLLTNSITVLSRLAQLVAAEPQSWVGPSAEMMAQGMVRGTLEGLITSWPAFADSARELIRRVNEYFERSAKLAELGGIESMAPGGRAKLAAASGVEGALESLHRGEAQLNDLLEKVGRSVVRGMAAQLKLELEPVRRMLVEEEGRPLAVPLRFAGREVTRGVFVIIREQLRRPLLLGAATAGVLVLGIRILYFGRG